MMVRDRCLRASIVLGVLLPSMLVTGALVVAAALALTSGSEPRSLETVSVSASSPTFASADEMAEASDLVVEATVIAVEPGRPITDPSDPDAGIITHLLELDVSFVLAGPPTGSVVVEQESTLLDGTPIVVNGVEPFEQGDSGIWFLVADPSGNVPYFAVINDQGFVVTP